jgi:hypothetical protein
MLHYPILYKTSSRLECRCPIGNDHSDKSMPDDHSKLVPPLPIPNRTVKQLCADDSAATSVKVGYRQASYMKKPHPVIRLGFFFVQPSTRGNIPRLLAYPAIPGWPSMPGIATSSRIRSGLANSERINLRWPFGPARPGSHAVRAGPAAHLSMTMSRRQSELSALGLGGSTLVHRPP